MPRKKCTPKRHVVTVHVKGAVSARVIKNCTNRRVRVQLSK